MYLILFLWNFLYEFGLVWNGVVRRIELGFCWVVVCFVVGGGISYGDFGVGLGWVFWLGVLCFVVFVVWSFGWWCEVGVLVVGVGLLFW